MTWVLVVIALVLTYISLKVGLILFRLAASAAWLALLVFYVFGGVFNLGDPWDIVIALVFLAMTVAPLTLQMVTEVKTEKDGVGWTTWRRNPSSETLSRSAEVKNQRREKLRAIRGRRRP